MSGDLISRQAALNQITAIETSIIPYDRAREYVDELKNYFIKIIETLPSAEPDNQVHLCDSCHYGYPVCPAMNNEVIFGNGKGHDNICACAKYIPSTESVRKAKVMKHKYWLGVSLNVVGGHTIGYEWICENCKKKVLNGDDYCSHCGARLEWNETD